MRERKMHWIKNEPEENQVITTACGLINRGGLMPQKNPKLKEYITCKRCLAILAKQAKLSTPKED